MLTTPPDAFALKNSGLDAFLHADVGAELNGSPLTILSVLARLGKDPWAQAAGWAALPTAAAIDGLSQSIAQMPLARAARAGSRDIAARLAQLLPGKPRHVVPAPAAASKSAAATPNWAPVAMVCYGITVSMVVTALLASRSSTNVSTRSNSRSRLPVNLLRCCAAPASCYRWAAIEACPPRSGKVTQ